MGVREASIPVYTWRDSGLHSRLLRGVDRAGELLRRTFGVTLPSLAPDSLLEAARRRARLDDFGDDTLREPLDVLCGALEREAQLGSFGRMVLRGQLVDALTNRLRLVAWAKQHPEVRQERIERPWVIVGLPRTGTTLLSILLGLDPELRPLLQWEASQPVPPPELATRAEDPRIATTARHFEQLGRLNPPIRAMHPMGATLATECVTLFVFDLRSLSIETQAFVPSYGSWLDHADMKSAYEIHRLALQVLQSRLPTAAWSLKTPNHLWCLETLLGFYPDARIVWTHRDPARVVPSVASLVTAFHRCFARRTDPVLVGEYWADKLELGLRRGMQFDAARDGAPWCHHLHYPELLADPAAAVQRIYASFGEEPRPLHLRRMRAWLRERPQEAFGRHAYQAADFGWTPEGLRERFAAYCQRYSVAPED